jgi:hypothetical protein
MKLSQISFKINGYNVKKNSNKLMNMFVRKYEKKEKHLLRFGFFWPSGLSHQNKTEAISKLDTIRKTIEERTKDLKNIIDNHRKALAKHIDNHVQNLEQM